VSATRRERRFGLTLKIFGASALVVMVVLGGTLALASSQATGNADRVLRERLANTSAVAGRFIAAEDAELASGADVAAQIPTFIAAVQKGDPGSLVDLASSYRDMIGADFTLITDRYGVLRARTDRPGAFGTQLGGPLIGPALEGAQTSGFLSQADLRLYLAVATPLRNPGSEAVQGMLLAARLITDSLAEEVKRASGSEIVFYLLNERNRPVVVASTVPRLAPRDSIRLDSIVDAAVPETAPGAGGGAPSAPDTGAAAAGAEVAARLGGEHLVGLRRELATPGGSPLGGYIALRSRDRELAAYRDTQRTLLLAGLLGLALALGGALLVARVIARPVRALAGVTRRVAEGDYDAKVEVTTRDEIGELAASFRRMVDELKAKQQLVELLTSGPQAATTPMDRSGSGAAAAATTRPGAAISGVLQPGALLTNRYEIKDVLGMGGMGVVYRAWDTELGDSVAIKTLRMEAMQSEPAAVERFKQEIRLARKITHRNVVRTHDLGEVAGSYFITMEFVEGQSLKHLIQARGPLPVNVVLTVGKQLCRALEVAHEQGVIHRDIKPQNLLIEPSGTLKVADFGIARLAKRSTGLTQAGMSVGTPEYMAPEQLMGENVDFRADIYATGAVLFEAATGRPPFVADSPITLVAMQLKETPPSPRSLNAAVPEPLAATILRALSKDPAGRPQSATLLFEQLDAVPI
jgi:HAMP domain-containing protein/predicted Ser/Thr protein kinase